MWFWIDGTPNYYNLNMMNIYYRRGSEHIYDKCLYLHHHDQTMHVFSCNRPPFKSFIRYALCEKDAIPNVTRSTLYQNQLQVGVHFNNVTSVFSSKFHQCPREHFTHNHFSCDVGSFCEVSTPVDDCILDSSIHSVSVEMFVCDDYDETVHFTQVCDYRPHCTDKSDEIFCHHPQHQADFR